MQIENGSGPNGSKTGTEKEIGIHIFSVSAAMVGVCLTVIGIFRAVSELKSFSTYGDDALALDGLLFLFSCILAYSALRSNSEVRRRGFERAADVVFISALSIMSFVCCFLVYSIL